MTPAFSTVLSWIVFFFQAEDGIRDIGVTGVQTCALPIFGADVKRFARLKGDIDHMGALSFLQGLLVILRDSGYAGLLLVLDEVETLQRVRKIGRASCRERV